MDPRTTPEQDAFRAEARAFLEEHCPQDLPPLDSPEGFPLHVEWEKKLFAHRWAVVDWPEEYGGRDCSLVEWLIFEEEYYRVGGPQRATQNGIFLLGPAILHFGTDEQKQRLLPKIASAEELWCQGWSEPGAGSDLAALTSRAERVDGGFKLYGAKTWSTRGTFSDKTFGLFRTDPGSSRHKGLTYFLVDLRAEGVSVRPINKLDGDEGFAEIFLDGAFVPDRDILGEVDKGWYVAMATTGPERGLTLRSPGRFMAQAARLVDLAKRGGDAVGPALRERVAARWMEAEAYRQYGMWTATRIGMGIDPGAESSVMKLHWSHLDIDIHETALDVLGTAGECMRGSDAGVDGGRWMKDYLFGLANPIWGGTSEIQRNIVAERLLGLPRK
ncbi:MAG: acyl-CoA dehydrogenase family protein [Myxococcota bacterium]|nr:acyl-CoA dehydrogenase family protein [Myxococcales bacterium]